MREIIVCEQGSEDWRKARAGVPTASNFQTVLAKGRGGSESLTRNKYLRQLAGERITGEPMETFQSGAMKRGNEMEERARNFYSFLTDAEPELVGFIRNGNKGASPDSLIGDEGLLEIKTCAAHILIEHILKGEFPPEHRAQTQGQLWIAEREWVDLICFWPGMPPFVKRAVRDESYIQTLSEAVDQFNDELAAMVSKINSFWEFRHAA